MVKHSLLVENIDETTRIDLYIPVNLKNFTRSQVQKLCDNGNVFVDNNVVVKNYRVSNGQCIEIYIPDKKLEIVAEDIPLQVLHHDRYLAIVEKPKGMLLYPTENQQSGTLANALMHKYSALSTIGGKERPGIVHRIDKDTSGIIIIALDDDTHSKLNCLMINHQIKRKYLAVVQGAFTDDCGTIEVPLGRDPANRTKMSVVPDGRYAKTGYKTLALYPRHSLVEFELFTGRTHQIRVHSAYKGHAIAGDYIYDAKRYNSALNGQCLHAKLLEFIHPITGNILKVNSFVPEYFKKFINLIK